MSKKEHQKFVRAKLRELNDIIDRKIVAGKSYKTEAMIHARLRRSLA